MTAQIRNIAITGFIGSAIIAMWTWNQETHNRHTGASISTHLNGPEVEAIRGASILYATPITFYGNVIDQHGDPVPNAEVHFYVQAGIKDSPPIKGTTDQAGNFSITQIHGIALGVGVSKPGYRQLPPQNNKVTSSGLFEYPIPRATLAPSRFFGGEGQVVESREVSRYARRLSRQRPFFGATCAKIARLILKQAFSMISSPEKCRLSQKKLFLVASVGVSCVMEPSKSHFYDQGAHGRRTSTHQDAG